MTEKLYIGFSFPRSPIVEHCSTLFEFPDTLAPDICLYYIFVSNLAGFI